MCLFCCILVAIVIVGSILIYLRIQSNHDVAPINSSSTTVDMHLNIFTNSSVHQLTTHQEEISDAIEESANTISDEVIVSVTNITFTKPNEQRRRLSDSDVTLVAVTLDIGVPPSDALSADIFNDFNFTNTLLSEMEDNEGSFSQTLEENLKEIDLNIEAVSVQHVTEKYVITVSADLNFDGNFVEEGIFIQLMNSERDWVLSQISALDSEFDVEDIWYLNGWCGKRGGLTMIASNSDSSKTLQNILCNAYATIAENIEDAVDTVNDRIEDASLSVQTPSDIRVCAVFDARIEACSAEQIQSRYICVNRPDTQDENGFYC